MSFKVTIDDTILFLYVLTKAGRFDLYVLSQRKMPDQAQEQVIGWISALSFYPKLKSDSLGESSPVIRHYRARVSK